MSETATYSTTHCTCEGFTTMEAVTLDRACGKAREMVTKVLSRFPAMSGDVTVALKHHFKLDVAAAKGLGRVYQEKMIDRVRGVFVKIDSDFKAGMTYVRGTGGGVGTVRKLRPKVITFHPPFFSISTLLDQATAVIHEQAHFASRLPGATNTISDRGWWGLEAYHELHPGVYRGLSTDQAITNADSYAFFAREVAEPDSYVWIGGG